jgi:hypothetical protein
LTAFTVSSFCGKVNKKTKKQSCLLGGYKERTIYDNRRFSKTEYANGLRGRDIYIYVTAQQGDQISSIHMLFFIHPHPFTQLH